MSSSRVMKWITGGLEALLAIPILGGSIVVGWAYLPLAVMLALHIVTLILTNKQGGPTVGSILGIVTSCIAWIPILGWIMHTLSAIFLMINAAQKERVNQHVA